MRQIAFRCVGFRATFLALYRLLEVRILGSAGTGECDPRVVAQPSCDDMDRMVAGEARLAAGTEVVEDLRLSLQSCQTNQFGHRRP